MTAHVQRIRYHVELEITDGWEVRRLQLEETLDRPWELRVQIATAEPLVDARLYVGDRITVTIESTSDDEAPRSIQGIIRDAQHMGRRNGETLLEVSVTPEVAEAMHVRRSRCFDRQPFLALLGEVLGHAIEARRLRREYLERDFFVQYDETDLNAALRLLSEEGITAQFCTEEGVVVLTDHNDGFACVGQPPTAEASEPPIIAVRTGGGDDDEAIVSFARVDRGHNPTRTETAWQWQSNPTQFLHDSKRGSGGRRHRSHARRRLPELGGDLVDITPADAQLAQDREAQSAVHIAGTSNHFGLRPGAVFELQGHPDGDFDVQYVVTRVTHGGACEAEGRRTAWSGADYENRFECVPASVPIRPPHRPKPSIPGVQTALVVGDEVGRVHTDVYGRVQLQLPWDESSVPSCFARVAQSWAGPGFGTMFMPRVGMEVVVAFIDGDPEQPLVTGCVYNGQNTPPWALPEHRTRSGVVTQSCPDAIGHNELRFEDEAGAEEVYLHAQRNHRQVIRANESANIGGSRSRTVSKNDTLTIGEDRTMTVVGSAVTQIQGGRTTEVLCQADGGADTLVVEGARNQEIRDRWNVVVGGSTQIDTTPERVHIQAPQEIVLEVGSTKLVLTPDALILVASTIQLQASGASLALAKEIFGTATTKIELTQGNGSARMVMAGGGLFTDSAEVTKFRCATGGSVQVDAGVLANGDAVRLSASSANVAVTATDVTTTAATIQSNATGVHSITGMLIRLN